MAFLTRDQLERHQLTELRSLLNEIVQRNKFYRPRLQDAGLDGSIETLEEFRQWAPFTTKDELVADQREHPPYGTNLTFPLEKYLRLHRTSGTSGNHLRWLDTAESWSWMVSGWQQVLEAAGVVRADRVFVAFSFGPFIGFWLAFEAAVRMGCLTIPGGGLESRTRLDVILSNKATVLCCTPTYALHLGEMAARSGLDRAVETVSKIIVGGEPGGSLPAVRRRIEEAWPKATVFDHHGMTEVGPVTYQTDTTPEYLHVIESNYLCEIVDPATGEPMAESADETGELVLTTLGRAGSPLLRYRTGDLVRRGRAVAEDPDQVTVKLSGGILGRIDDMIVVRGVNLYPSAVDKLVHSQQGVGEYRVEIRTVAGLDELELRVEPRSEDVDAGELVRKLEDAFRRAYNLRVPVTIAAPGELPRFELKAKRWVRV